MRERLRGAGEWVAGSRDHRAFEDYLRAHAARWHPSSVKHLLSRAERLGVTPAASAQVAPDVWR